MAGKSAGYKLKVARSALGAAKAAARNTNLSQGMRRVWKTRAANYTKKIAKLEKEVAQEGKKRKKTPPTRPLPKKAAAKRAAAKKAVKKAGAAAKKLSKKTARRRRKK